jgi:hypothetical protein
MKYLRIFIDLFFTTIIFTVIFWISYKIISTICHVPEINWYIYIVVGFLQTVFFRLLGLFLGPKHVR